MSNLEIESDEVSISRYLSEGLTQKINRTINGNEEQFVGLFRCDFEKSQTRFALNIPLYPPLGSVPNVDVLVLDHDARFRMTDIEKFGIRIEINRGLKNIEAEKIFVEVIAIANNSMDLKK